MKTEEYMIVIAKQLNKDSFETLSTSILSYSTKTQAEVCYHQNMADAYSNDIDFELVQLFNPDGMLIKMDYKDK